MSDENIPTEKNEINTSAKRAMAEDDNFKNTSTLRKTINFIIYVALLIALVVGSVLIYEGLQQKPKNDAPKLNQEIVAPPDPAAVQPNGPNAAKVVDMGKEGEKSEDTVVDPENHPESMLPNHLFIPALGIYAYINTENNVGTIDNTNSLVLPTAHQVTRFQEGSNVLDPEGNILLAGHVEWYGDRGALYNLGKVQSGNIAYVTDADNNLQKFKLVSAKETYKDKFPQELLNTSKKGSKQLNIVTCTDLRLVNGQWVYDENLIATFVPTD